MIWKKKIVYLSEKLSLFLEKFCNNDYKKYVHNNEIYNSDLFKIILNFSLTSEHISYIDTEIINEIIDIKKCSHSDITLNTYAFIERYTTLNKKIIIII